MYADTEPGSHFRDALLRFGVNIIVCDLCPCVLCKKYFRISQNAANVFMCRNSNFIDIVLNYTHTHTHTQFLDRSNRHQANLDCTHLQDMLYWIDTDHRDIMRTKADFTGAVTYYLASDPEDMLDLAILSPQLQAGSSECNQVRRR